MKFNKKFYEKYGYKVTDEPIITHQHKYLSPTLERLHHAVFKPVVSTQTVIEIERLIEQYPDILALTNYLHIAYMKTRQEQKALDYLKKTVSEHPNYVFGTINLANHYITEGQINRAAEIMKEPFDVCNIEQGEYIHKTALMGYYHAAARIEIERGNIDKAKELHRVLFDYDPKHETVEKLAYHILAERISNLSDMKATKHREVASVSKPISGQFLSDTTGKPLFNHHEINQLYTCGLDDIPKEVIQSILSLPRQTLIQDLEHVLLDSVLRYEHFSSIDDWEYETHQFAIHAVYLLTELKSYESLSCILDILRQDEAFSEYWFSDSKEHFFNEPLYILGENQLALLKTCVLEDNIFTWHRTLITDVVTQVALKQPERRSEAMAWFKEVIHHHLDNPNNDNLIDSTFLGMMVGDLIDCRAIELKEDIEQLYATDWVSDMDSGKLSEVITELEKPFDAYHIKPLPNDIFELYSKEYQSRGAEYESDEAFSEFEKSFNDPYEIYMRDLIVTKLLSGMTNEDDDDYYDDDDDEDWTPQIPVKREEPKTGRNDPCPCGSGKKYKKCHGK
jgi:tetratricopeptide (TPR) repeat protein